jgi:hypothetical protein
MKKFSFALLLGVVMFISSGGSALADTTPPFVSGGQPDGTLPPTTTETTLLVRTDEFAMCKYTTASSTPFASMGSYFSNTSGTLHLTTIGVTENNRYEYYVRCADEAGNVNLIDYQIYFSVARKVTDTTPPVISNSSLGGSYAAGTRTLSFSLNTDENATCRHATSSLVFGSMAGRFSHTGGLNHEATLTGLSDGQSGSVFVRCEDAARNANTSDAEYKFTIATSTASSAPVGPAPTVASISLRVTAAQVKLLGLLKNPAAPTFRDGLLGLIQELVLIQKDLQKISGR